ncbi:OLC1v1020335C1 [Oldenlandia corymbosa var. corymbosa]|uniref:OLC1v1020335C1 n=1 Tax=Oldenlandia corymbosa var. corymbosa TaxID=529605 RepID=A0AAV1EG55_OLDCO|nr:OLC1v1020335C1 [Oldenlandia corymbosa var. corymbosa]
MSVLSSTRRLARALAIQSPVLLNSARFESCRSLHTTLPSGVLCGNSQQLEPTYWDNTGRHPEWFLVQRRLYSSGPNAVETAPTESVKDLYDNMLKSVAELKTAPPNSWLWSLVQKSATREDIELLFNILQRLRIFRLSNLRIHDNFNCALCEEVVKACVRAGAIDYGKKALWKHNLFGLTPTVGSAHKLLLHAEQHKDVKLMRDVMELLKKNNLPLQAGTADIVFRICHDTDNWGYLSKYAKRFVKAGINLRQTSIDTWMDFAANKGDLEALWIAEKLRSETKKQHTLRSGFACAKGLLLENKPENAAEIIELLNQTLPDGKRQGIIDQLQKLVREWPLQVIKHQKEEDVKVVASALKNSIPAMVAGLSSMGGGVSVDMEYLDTNEGVLS